jgi:hypothetical protein
MTNPPFSPSIPDASPTPYALTACDAERIATAVDAGLAPSTRPGVRERLAPVGEVVPYEGDRGASHVTTAAVNALTSQVACLNP